MLGRNHALSGAVAWLAVAPAATGLPADELAVGGLVCAGAALAPDVDHPGSSVSRRLGLAGQATGAAVNAVAGHRGITHSLLFVALAAVGAWAVVAVPATPLPAAITAGVIVALGARLLAAPLRSRRAALLSLAGGAATVGLVYSGTVALGWWFTAAVAGGVALHLAGDLATDSGIPLLAPITGRRVSLGLFRTGGLVEHAASLVMLAAVALLGYQTFL